MLPVNNTSWGSGDYSVLTNLTEEECLQACLNDCMCVVVTHGVLPTVGDAACYMKMLPMTDGRQGADITTRSFVKVAGDILPPSGKQRKRRIAVELVLMIGIGLLVLSLFLQLPSSWRVFVTKSPKRTVYRVLGNGAFGTVFEGSLPNERANEGSVPDERAGAMKVAVKKLHVQEAQAENERSDFETEMKAIGTSHHKNLVRLYGFCKEGPHRFLVYEFMCKGSLGKVLFRGSVFLDWRVRVQIAKGIARGIRYLHQGYGPQILHIDIKPQNILLGQNYNPKICDFGIAKLFTAEQTHHTLTSARGTTDYMAPELLNAPKADIYSFGVVLLEIICRKRTRREEINWIYDCLGHGTLDELVEHQQRQGVTIELSEVQRMVSVGLRCIQDNPDMRPSINKVIQVPPRPQRLPLHVLELEA
ncbi:hypothetical protein SUGI_0018820 [Cryptomeria japonica]|nr:hypothetical protein SUGI_0018820 [Cryptomeria japonica]